MPITTPCEHEHWEIQDSNFMGFGTCLDCHRQIKLSELFNKFKDRIESIVALHSFPKIPVADPILLKPLPAHMAECRSSVCYNQDYWNGYIDGLRGAANEVESMGTTVSKMRAMPSQILGVLARDLRKIADDLESSK